jgi:hypothetical protein
MVDRTTYSSSNTDDDDALCWLLGLVVLRSSFSIGLSVLLLLPCV